MKVFMNNINNYGHIKNNDSFSLLWMKDNVHVTMHKIGCRKIIRMMFTPD